MAGARQRLGGDARAGMTGALADGRRKAAERPSPSGREALAALQRSAGNAAVNALIAARFRFPGDEAVGRIDRALRELRRDEPALDVVEPGLREAKAVGIPVELEGPKPPPSALAVTKTGFGPERVPQKKPTPPPKRTPATSLLGRAAAHAKGAARKASAGGGAVRSPAVASVAPAPSAAAPLSAEQQQAPPAPPARTTPEQDSAFTAVTSTVRGVAAARKAHPPAAAKAKEAQDAALAPTDDVSGQAKAAKVDTMDAQPIGGFDKKAFVTAVKAAIEAKSPKTLKEADDYTKSGKAGEVKGEVKGLVGQGTEGQAKDVETAAAAPPDTSKAVPKPVTPMGPEEQPPAPVVPASGAVPKPAPPEQLNLAAGKQQAASEMADGGVTEEQLKQSNEPDFQQAVTAKDEAAAHADTAPGQYRAQEQQTISQGTADATAQTQAGVAGMHGSKAAALASLMAHKATTKSKDEQRRAEVTAKVQGIFATTETEVKKILDGIDPKVDKEFEVGEGQARKEFEGYVAAKMSAYKADRYSGWLGGLRWMKDKLAGMPSKVDEFYEAGRELYLKRMDGVISRVADIVGNDLAAAKRRIAQGKTEIATYAKSLPKDLQKVGAQAGSEIGERFSQLESDVDAKQDAVVDGLATKYVEARKGLDDRIEELQAENKGLVDKAVGAIKAVVNTIRGLVSMLTSVLARAAGIVGDIVSAPIRFLSNLVAGVKGGILAFKDNILAHLKKGLFGWLFGALAEGGVELPESIDVKGILKMLASIFGLTWANIRNRLVKQIGEKAMGAVEKGVEIFQLFATHGVAGLWQMLVDKLGDIKDMILEKVQEFVVGRIVVAGIQWLIGLLNPAAAFIKACKMIYDIVMFFVDNGEKIMQFVSTVLDSMTDVVKGNVSGVVAKIEDALGRMVPIIIGFLASAIGLGGIGEKIRSIVETLRKPVTKALDVVIKQGLKLAGPIIRGISGIAGTVKKKVAAGKAWVKDKAARGGAWAKDKARRVGEALGIVKKPFGSGPARHTLKVDLKTGGITMASREAPVVKALEFEVAKVNERRKAALLPPLPRDVILTNVLPQIARAQAAIGAARSEKHNRTRVAQQQLDQLAVAIESMLSQIGGDVELANDPAPTGIGNVARHSQNSKLFPREGRKPIFWVESEHVIPVSLISSLFAALGDANPIIRGSAEDTVQHTILVYERAADIKTRGGGLPGKATELSDLDAIYHTTSILEQGRPNIGKKSTSRVAGGHRQLPEAERNEREAAWRPRRSPAELADLLRAMIPDRMAERIEDLMRAISRDHDKLGKKRKDAAPVPDEGKVRSAAMLQVHDIVEIFLARMRRRGGG